jgi:hypothetical protein
MNWTDQDWEHEYQKDEIYLMEYRKLMEKEWEQSEKRKPAKIKILTNLEKQNENKLDTSKI